MPRRTKEEKDAEARDQKRREEERQRQYEELRRVSLMATGASKFLKTIGRTLNMEVDQIMEQQSSGGITFSAFDDFDFSDEESKKVVTTKTVTVTKQDQDFSCWNCDDSLYGHRFVNREGHPYCVKCYNKTFANTCRSCAKLISVDNKDLAFKDQHWHDYCFKCSDCKNSLVSSTFGAQNDRLYCGPCWDENFAPKCTRCVKPFQAGSMKLSWNGGEWHKDCFQCAHCKSVIGQEAFHPQDNKPYCERCWEDLFSIKCSSCTKPIRNGGVTYKLEPFHRECFSCKECKKSLAGQRFTLRDNKPICSECFGSRYAYRCFDCKQPITGVGGTRYIIFEDHQWHSECFSCKVCNASLVGVNFVADGYDNDLETLCQPCGFKRRGWDFTTGTVTTATTKVVETSTTRRGRGY